LAAALTVFLDFLAGFFVLAALRVAFFVFFAFLAFLEGAFLAAFFFFFAAMSFTPWMDRPQILTRLPANGRALCSFRRDFLCDGDHALARRSISHAVAGPGGVSLRRTVWKR
jgi:hypothetical protein